MPLEPVFTRTCTESVSPTCASTLPACAKGRPEVLPRSTSFCWGERLPRTSRLLDTAPPSSVIAVIVTASGVLARRVSSPVAPTLTSEGTALEKDNTLATFAPKYETASESSRPSSSVNAADKTPVPFTTRTKSAAPDTPPNRRLKDAICVASGDTNTGADIEYSPCHVAVMSAAPGETPDTTRPPTLATPVSLDASEICAVFVTATVASLLRVTTARASACWYSPEDPMSRSKDASTLPDPE
mmetsp:Transcript_10478/g.31138  ORF Transcript_10478/g.31138 Transcript_10478/m.31138 type:complete len:243 (+) Transcript_10478:631-1359(+)